MNEKTDFFQPMEKSCIHESVCVSFPEKCHACRLNPNKHQPIGQPIQEKKTLGNLKENITERYKQMPDQFKLFGER